eukprot:6848563-Pyramimonas_sp.AAC.1
MHCFRNSAGHSQMPHNRCNVAQKTCERASLRHPDKTIALQPNVRRLIVNEQYPCKSSIIADHVGASRQSQMRSNGM